MNLLWADKEKKDKEAELEEMKVSTELNSTWTIGQTLTNLRLYANPIMIVACWTFVTSEGLNNIKIESFQILKANKDYLTSRAENNSGLLIRWTNKTVCKSKEMNTCESVAIWCHLLTFHVQGVKKWFPMQVIWIITATCIITDMEAPLITLLNKED